MTSPTWRAPPPRGAVEVVFVDLDEVIPGSIGEATGALTLNATDDAASYGVVMR